MRVPPARAPLAGGKAPPRFHCFNNGGAALISTWLAVAVVLAFALAACAVPLR
jgi:hypothetical protein